MGTDTTTEIGEFWDAGTTTFYLADFWSLWDLFVIGVGVAFFITRKSCAPALRNTLQVRMNRT